MSGGEKGGRPESSWAKTALTTVAVLVVASAAWWGSGRLSADARRLAIERAEATAAPLRLDGTVRILAWNIAHGRGDAEQGVLQNWAGGSAEERIDRLEEMAEVLRRADADIVVLNEVDFDAGWSHGIDQAAFLARAARYPNRVEQRNFDFRVPFESWAFGNALLTRFPIADARWIELPDHSRVEDILIGSKEAALVRLTIGTDTLSVVPVHLEFREGDTRLEAVPILEAVRAEEPAPLVLAGDFNTAPPGWPATTPTTALGELLDLGWTSVRAERTPGPDALTFPTYDPVESRDWILAEPSLEIVDARIVRGAEHLSDHAPVVAVLRLPSDTARVRIAGPSASSRTDSMASESRPNR